MARLTRLRAWDDAWERTKAVTLNGAQQEPTEQRLRLQDLMGQLSQQALPVEAIYRIADAIECAWQIGRRDN